VRRGHVLGIDVEEPTISGSGGWSRNSRHDHRRVEQIDRLLPGMGQFEADAEFELSSTFAADDQQRVHLPQADAAMIGEAASEYGRAVLVAADFDPLRGFEPLGVGGLIGLADAAPQFGLFVRPGEPRGVVRIPRIGAGDLLDVKFDIDRPTSAIRGAIENAARSRRVFFLPNQAAGRE